MSSAPPRRSFLAAYGPAIGACLFLLVAIAVLFLSPAPSRDATASPSPSTPRKPYSPTPEQQKKVQEIAKRTGGDWVKTSAAEKAEIEEMSQGHGKQMLQMMYDSQQKK
jgi:hypothetical protein